MPAKDREACREKKDTQQRYNVSKKDISCPSNPKGSAMHLSKEQAERFYRLFDALITFANDTHGITDELFDYETMGIYPEKLEDVAEVLWSDLSIIDDFIAQNPFGFDPRDLEAVRLWTHAITDSFIVMEHNLACSVFVSGSFAYGVKGISHSIKEILPETPTVVNATLLPFDNSIVYAMQLKAMPIVYGSGMKEMFKNSLEDALDCHPLIMDAGSFVAVSAEIRETGRPQAQGRPFQERKELSALREGDTFELDLHKGALAGLNEEERKKAIDREVQKLYDEDGFSRAEFIRSIALEKEPCFSLSKILGSFTKEDLVHLARTSNLKGYSRLKKAELQDMVSDRINTDTSAWDAFLDLCSQPVFDTFLLLIESGGTLSLNTSEVNAFEKSLLTQTPYSFVFFHDDTFTFLIPEDFRQWCSQLSVEEIKLRRKETETLLLYPRVYTELCGIVDSEELYALYCAHSDEAADEEGEGKEQRYRYREMSFEDFVITITQEIILEEQDFEVWIDGDRLYFVYFELGDEYNGIYGTEDSSDSSIHRYREYLLARHEEIPMKQLDKGEAFDFDAFDHSMALPQAKLLRNLFDANVPEGANDYFFADTLMEEIYSMAQFGFGAPEYLEYFEECGLVFDPKTINDLLVLLCDCLNSLPLWVNNGWSPNELLEKESDRRLSYNEDGSIKPV